MHIHNIQKKMQGTKVILTADVSFQNGTKDTIYFSCDKKFAPFLAQDATTFLATMLLPGLKEKEAISTESSVSKAFLQNTKRIMSLLSSWDTSFNEITISA